MDHRDDTEGFLAYAAGQVASAKAGLAEHPRTGSGLCACGRPWPCREVLWWSWVRSHYARCCRRSRRHRRSART